MQDLSGDSLSDWYKRSKTGKSAFFRSLPNISDDQFKTMVDCAIQSKEGELRPLALDKGRKGIPPEADLLKELEDPKLRNETRLQYLLSHRSRLLEHQKIVAREAPCSFKAVRRPAVADFIAVNQTTPAPIIVEVKVGSATDSICGVLFELLVQWCFHKSAWEDFLNQLKNAGYPTPGHVTQPEAAVVAPTKFYTEAVRRSKDPRRCNEVTHARRFSGVLKTHFGLEVSFLQISDDWHSLGKNLSCSIYRFEH